MEDETDDSVDGLPDDKVHSSSDKSADIQKKSPQANNVVVNFKLSDDRMKAKKQAAKERREFIRERTRDKTVG